MRWFSTRLKMQFLKKAKSYNEKCTKQHIYDIYVLWKKIYKSLIKQYYVWCKEINIQK